MATTAAIIVYGFRWSRGAYTPSQGVNTANPIVELLYVLFAIAMAWAITWYASKVIGLKKAHLEIVQETEEDKKKLKEELAEWLGIVRAITDDRDSESEQFRLFLGTMIDSGRVFLRRLLSQQWEQQSKKALLDADSVREHDQWRAGMSAFLLAAFGAPEQHRFLKPLLDWIGTMEYSKDHGLDSGTVVPRPYVEVLNGEIDALVAVSDALAQHRPRIAITEAAKVYIKAAYPAQQQETDGEAPPQSAGPLFDALFHDAPAEGSSSDAEKPGNV